MSISKSDNERFIAYWQAYQGMLGFVRYTLSFLLVGCVLSPLILIWLNPNIGERLQSSTLERLFLPLTVIVLLFALLPMLIMATVFWFRNQKRFKHISTGQNRYLPFKSRAWMPGDLIWKKCIRVMTFLSGLSLYLSFWLVLGRREADTITFLFQITLLYFVVDTLYRLYLWWLMRMSDSDIAIPAIFKGALLLCFAAQVLIWTIFLIHL